MSIGKSKGALINKSKGAFTPKISAGNFRWKWV